MGTHMDMDRGYIDMAHMDMDRDMDMAHMDMDRAYMDMAHMDMDIFERQIFNIKYRITAIQG
jgi:hypothetical protein